MLPPRYLHPRFNPQKDSIPESVRAGLLCETSVENLDSLQEGSCSRFREDSGDQRLGFLLNATEVSLTEKTFRVDFIDIFGP